MRATPRRRHPRRRLRRCPRWPSRACSLAFVNRGAAVTCSCASREMKIWASRYTAMRARACPPLLWAPQRTTLSPYFWWRAQASRPCARGAPSNRRRSAHTSASTQRNQRDATGRWPPLTRSDCARSTFRRRMAWFSTAYRRSCVAAAFTMPMARSVHGRSAGPTSAASNYSRRLGAHCRPAHAHSPRPQPSPTAHAHSPRPQPAPSPGRIPVSLDCYHGLAGTTRFGRRTIRSPRALSTRAIGLWPGLEPNTPLITVDEGLRGLCPLLLPANGH